MADRISDMANKAREYAEAYVAECKHYGYYMEHNEYEIRFESKFAELIIKECADICYNREYANGSAYGDEIMEHFGIDE